MERASKRITTMILAAALLLVAAFVYTGTEVYASQTKPLKAGQYYQLGTCTQNNINRIQLITDGENIYGDKIPYNGQYYYVSDEPDASATYIDPELTFYDKYYKSDINITYPTRIRVGYKNVDRIVWGETYDMERGYYSDEFHCYWLSLIPGNSIDGPVKLFFDMEDKGEPWGIQVLSGDGTKEHPFRFGLLFSEPYSVGLNAVENGTVSVHPNAEKGETVELDLKPDFGYEVENVSVKRTDTDEAVEIKNEDGKYSFVMPAADVVVDATFRFNWDLTIVAGITESDGTKVSYDSIETAIENWTDGTTLTLLDGVNINAPINVTQSRTLDLNGYVLKADGKAFTINGGSLNIKDSAPDRKTSFDGKDYTGGQLIGSVVGADEDGPIADALISVAKGGLTVDGGTLTNQQSNDFPTWAIATLSGAKVRINDGYFNAYKTIAMGSTENVCVELAGGYHYATPTNVDMEFQPIVWARCSKKTTGIELTGGYYRWNPAGGTIPMGETSINIDPLPIAEGYQSEEKTNPAQDDWKWNDCNYRVVGNPHIITTEEGIEHGTIQAPEGAKTGEKVTLTATPEAKYRLKNYVVKNADGDDIEVTNDTFIMPESDVTVSAVFEGIPVSKLRFANTVHSLEVGESKNIRITVNPGDALNQTLKWSSSDETVLTVNAESNKGTVTGVKEGKVKVTVETTDGSGVSLSTIIKVTHQHVLTHVAAKAASCTEAGNIEYWRCDGGDYPCRRCFTDEEGSTEIAADSIFIKALGHDWCEWETTEEATEEKEGTETRTCSKCTAEETRPIPKLEHTHVPEFVKGKAATCTESGQKDYYKCTADECTAIFEDEACTLQTSTEGIKIPAKGHTPAEAEKGEETEATCCSAGGYNLTTKCSECNCVLKVERVVIPADSNAHVWGDWIVTTPATESEEGVETRTCYLCGEKETRPIPVKDDDKPVHKEHIAGEAVKEKVVAASCTENGSYDQVVYCTDCGVEISRTTVTVNALGHTLTKVEAKAPTVNESGNSEYYVCKKCGKYFSDAEGKIGIKENSWVLPAKNEDNSDSDKTVKKDDEYVLNGNTYRVTSVAGETAKGKVMLIKAANKKNVVVPASVKLRDGKVYNVTSIGKKAFASSKATKLTLKTKMLTKTGVKDCLKGSKIKTIKVKVGKKKENNKYVKKYKKFFSKKNSGKKVKI